MSTHSMKVLPLGELYSEVLWFTMKNFNAFATKSTMVKTIGGTLVHRKHIEVGDSIKVANIENEDLIVYIDYDMDSYLCFHVNLICGVFTLQLRYNNDTFRSLEKPSSKISLLIFKAMKAIYKNNRSLKKFSVGRKFSHEIKSDHLR